MRFGTVVILALGLTLVGCVAEPDPVAREWHPAGPFPSRLFDCVFEPTQEALAATDAGLVFAFAGPEHAENSNCIQEADGPGSIGSDDRVEGADGPVAGVFVSVYESERIMALQRLSSGADAVGSLAIDGLAAGGDEIGLLTRSGDSFTLYQSRDRGRSWDAPIDLGEFPSGTARGLVWTPGGFRVLIVSGVEPVGELLVEESGYQRVPVASSLSPIGGLLKAGQDLYFTRSTGPLALAQPEQDGWTVLADPSGDGLPWVRRLVGGDELWAVSDWIHPDDSCETFTASVAGDLTVPPNWSSVGDCVDGVAGPMIATGDDLLSVGFWTEDGSTLGVESWAGWRDSPEVVAQSLWWHQQASTPLLPLRAAWTPLEQAAWALNDGFLYEL